VAAEVKLDFYLPTEGQTICKVTESVGNNLFEVETPTGERYIASMPNKFRKYVYIRRNRSYVVTEPIPEGKKVRGEIVRILLEDQIKYFKENNAWPERFDTRSNMDKLYEKNNISDRGSVHGSKVLYLAGSGGEQAVCRDLAAGEEGNDYGLQPNYNKKAISRFVMVDSESESESDDEEEDTESEEDEAGSDEKSDCDVEDAESCEEDDEVHPTDQSEDKCNTQDPKQDSLAHQQLDPKEDKEVCRSLENCNL